MNNKSSFALPVLPPFDRMRKSNIQFYVPKKLITFFPVLRKKSITSGIIYEQWIFLVLFYFVIIQ